MTETETLKILAMLSAFYGEGKSDAGAMSKAWHLLLEPYRYDDAEQAVIEFARTDRREYGTFPSPGKIVEAVEGEQKKYLRLFNKIWHGADYDTLEDWEKKVITKGKYEQATQAEQMDLLTRKEELIDGFRKASAKERQNHNRFGWQSLPGE